MSGLTEALKPELTKLTWTLSSDALDSKLEAVTREREAARELKTTPPKILYSPAPAARSCWMACRSFAGSRTRL
jgi:hypothetical protein